MPLDTFIAGCYSGAYNAQDLGAQENGFTVRFQARGQEIGESDQWGESLVDLVYRGGRYQILVDSLTYKPGTIAAMWPWGAFGTAGTIGRLASAIARAVVLTAMAGTPAANSPATLTAPLSFLAPGNNVDLLFHSKVRKVPVLLEVLFGGTSWITTT